MQLGIQGRIKAGESLLKKDAALVEPADNPLEPARISERRLLIDLCDKGSGRFVSALHLSLIHI